jgi:hypothetical protein
VVLSNFWGRLDSLESGFPPLAFQIAHVVNRLCKHWFHFKWNKSRRTKIPRHLSCSVLLKPWFQMHMYPHFGTASWAPFLSLQYFNNLVGCSQINRQTTGQIISLLWTWLLESIMNSGQAASLGSHSPVLCSTESLFLSDFTPTYSGDNSTTQTFDKLCSQYLGYRNLAHQPVGWKDPRSSSMQ